MHLQASTSVNVLLTWCLLCLTQLKEAMPLAIEKARYNPCRRGTSFHGFRQKLPLFWYNSMKICPTIPDSSDCGGTAAPPPPRTPMIRDMYGYWSKIVAETIVEIATQNPWH